LDTTLLINHYTNITLSESTKKKIDGLSVQAKLSSMLH